MGGMPGKVMGVVRGGKLGMPGMLGGAGAGMVTPVNIGGGSAGGSAAWTMKSSLLDAGGGPKMACSVVDEDVGNVGIVGAAPSSNGLGSWDASSANNGVFSVARTSTPPTTPPPPPPVFNGIRWRYP